MHERMQTKKAKILMKKRQSTIEPVIGTLVNYQGMKKVNTKGLHQANKCMTLSAIAYNIKKLLRYKPQLAQFRVNEMKQGIKDSLRSHLPLFKLTHCLLQIYSSITGKSIYKAQLQTIAAMTK